MKIDPRILDANRKNSDMRFAGTLELYLSFAALYYAFYSGAGALAPLLASNGDAALREEDAAWLRLFNIPMVVVVPILVATKLREILDLVRRNPILVAFVLLATISFAWSVNPAVTARRLLFLWTMTLFAFFCAVRFTPEQIIRHGTNFFLVTLIGSILMAAAVPRLGFMEGTLFRGVFQHKNAYGACYQVGWIFFLLSWRFGLLAPRIAIAALGATFVTLVLADSATALGLSVLVSIMFVCLGWVKLPPAIGWTMVALGITAGASLGMLLTIDPSILFQALGRGSDLTGRVPLWAFLLEMIEQRPWTGYGYQAFFTVPEYSQHLLDALTWEIPHAHSGYVEALLGLGVFGLVLAVALIASTMTRGLRLLRRGELLLANLVILFLVCLIGRNFSESDMMQHQSLLWFVWAYMAAAASGILATAEPAKVVHNRRSTDPGHVVTPAWRPMPRSGKPDLQRLGRPLPRLYQREREDA